MKNGSKSGLSESFIAGVIAIVFLIVGYQTAMFVYRASVMKIIPLANLLKSISLPFVQ